MILFAAHVRTFIALVLHLTEATYTWSYIGCYKDNPRDRKLTSASIHLDSTATVTQCVSHCASQGFKYAGLKSGAECRCGNTTYTRHGNKGTCNNKCSGNGGHCGGYGSISIYETGSVTFTRKHLGCYKNSKFQSVLFGRYTIMPSGMTADFCINFCVVSGFMFAGLQNGQECWCGNSGYDKYGRATDCAYSCPGDETQNCGGWNRISVYSMAIYKQKYLGCYKDDPEARALTKVPSQFHFAAAAPLCVDHCTSREFKYAALENGHQCRCGNSGYDKYRTSTGCASACPVESQNCGGEHRIEVYTAEYVNISPATASGAIFTDILNTDTPAASTDSSMGQLTGEDDVSKSSTTSLYIGIGVVAFIICATLVAALLILSYKKRLQCQKTLLKKDTRPSDAVQQPPTPPLQSPSFKVPHTHVNGDPYACIVKGVTAEDSKERSTFVVRDERKDNQTSAPSTSHHESSSSAPVRNKHSLANVMGEYAVIVQNDPKTT